MCLISVNTAHLAADKVRLRPSADDPHLPTSTHTHTSSEYIPPVPMYAFAPHNGAHLRATITHELPAAAAGGGKQSRRCVWVCVRAQTQVRFANIDL